MNKREGFAVLVLTVCVCSAVLCSAAQDAEDFSWDGVTASEYVTLGQVEGLEFTLEPSDPYQLAKDRLQQEFLDHADIESVTVEEGTVQDGDTVHLTVYYAYSPYGKWLGQDDAVLTIGEDEALYEGFMQDLIGQPIASDTAYYDRPLLEDGDSAYTVDVHSVERKIMPDLDDAWVSSYTNGEFTSVEDLLESYRQEIEEQILEEEKESLWQTVENTAAVISYPAGMVGSSNFPDEKDAFDALVVHAAADVLQVEAQPDEQLLKETVRNAVWDKAVLISPEVEMKAAANLNIRSEASTEGEILGKLAEGETVTVLSVENGWAVIRFGEGEAYCSADYLTEAE